MWDSRYKWYNIGLQLHLTIHELKNIEAEDSSLEKRFNLMIETRLKQKPCTWRNLYEALMHKTVNMPNVADELARSLPPGKLGT